MTTKSFEGSPFGSQSARFTLNGVHPNLLYTGRMPYDSKITAPAGFKLGPGSYDILRYSEFSDINVSRSADGPGWEKALQTEKLAKMPNLLYQEEYKKKLEEKRQLGPGHYEFTDSFTKKLSKPQSNRGMLDALSDRFAYVKISENPGPFEYGLPDSILEEKRKNKPGKVSVVEYSKESRSLPIVGSEVPPATYNHKNSIDELIKKKVSKRGPYELFSLNRSAPVKQGFYVEDLDKLLGPGQYDLRTFVDNLKDSSHVKKGKFSKIEQYPVASGDRQSIFHTSLNPRNPSWPGPGHYDSAENSKIQSNPPPFLSSSIRSSQRYQKDFNLSYNNVGVGRYDIQKREETDHINSHQSVFNSKTSQITESKGKTYLEERLKPHNLEKKEKINLHLTGNTHG